MNLKQVGGTFLGLMTLALAVSSSVNAVELGEIVRNDDDGDGVIESTESIRHMDHASATSYCASMGTRLPTARELAKISQSMGAEGIRPTAFPRVGWSSEVVVDETMRMLSENFYQVFKGNAHDGVVVDFYFNPDGYQPSPLDEEEYFLWSSSIYSLPRYSGGFFTYAYAMTIARGEISPFVIRSPRHPDEIYPYDRGVELSAVRCVQP